VRPRLYGHRGAAAEQPENTLPSFALALELGADALELDVHCTRDGVIAVSHDPDGARMADVQAAIRDSTWDEVARWDAGWGFLDDAGGRPFAGRGIRFPRLEELLDAFPRTPLNIDLKAPVADEAVALLRRARAQERVCLTSFHGSTVRRVRALGYEGPTGLARSEVAWLLALPAAAQRGPLRPRGSAAQLPLSLARPWVIARCKQLGLRVDFWTVNDAGIARGLVALGADGIMTDDPRAIAPALAALDRPSKPD
jgi:glycerophosphoryl diester phosphodiesterase